MGCSLFVAARKHALIAWTITCWNYRLPSNIQAARIRETMFDYQSLNAYVGERYFTAPRALPFQMFAQGEKP